MMSPSLSCLLTLAALEWFPGGSRALPRGDSASSDAPATAYSYGPRAEARLAVDLALFAARRESRTFRLGFTGLAAFANGARLVPIPSELARTGVELGIAWSFQPWLVGRLPPTTIFEVGVSIGRHGAFATEGYWLQDPYRTNDVPFGGGGWYVAVDGALRLPVRPTLDVTARATLRAFMNAFPDWVGAHEASDVVADALYEGGRTQGAVELGLRWRWSERTQPLAWLHADVLDPHDDTAKTLWLGRLEGGVALPRRALELVPFAGIEAGHGAGLLVNRTELRLNAGLRLYAR